MKKILRSMWWSLLILSNIFLYLVFGITLVEEALGRVNAPAWALGIASASWAVLLSILIALFVTRKKEM